MPVDEVAALFRLPFVSGLNGTRTPDPDEIQRILNEFEMESAEPKTAPVKASGSHGEQTISGNRASRFNRTVQVAESHFRTWLRGVRVDLVFVLNLRTERALYYDYAGNLSSTGQRPFACTAINRVEDRWYGCGLFEEYAPQEHFIDLQYNRENYRESRSGRMDFQDPEATEEGSLGLPLQFGNPRPYTLRTGKKAEDAYSFVVAPPASEHLVKLREQQVQSVQLESGIVSAGEGGMSGLNVSRTKYGIVNIERNADILKAFHLSELKRGVRDVVQLNIDVVFEHMADVEKFGYDEGTERVITSIRKEDIGNMRFKVRMALFQVEREDNLQRVATAIQLGRDYAALPWMMQRTLRPLYIQQARILRVQNPELIFADPGAEPPQQGPQIDPVRLMSSFSSLITAVAKAGGHLSLDDLNAVLAQSGLPPVQAPPVTIPPPQIVQPPQLPNGPDRAPAAPSTAAA